VEIFEALIGSDPICAFTIEMASVQLIEIGSTKTEISSLRYRTLWHCFPRDSRTVPPRQSLKGRHGSWASL